MLYNIYLKDQWQTIEIDQIGSQETEFSQMAELLYVLLLSYISKFMS